MLMPGLGHAYLRRWSAALLFGAPPFLLAALVAGLLVANGPAGLVGLVISPIGLSLLGVINIAAALWRVAATIDAWRRAVTRGMGSRSLVASASGLVCSVAVLSSLHVVAGGYIATASSVVGGIFGSPDGTNGTGPAPAQWDGTARLNVLLVGIDRRGSGVDFNTDTMIVVSIDPATRRVVLFSLPRDTVDVPVPAGPARNVFGSLYRGKINSWYAAVAGRADLYPGTAQTRGYNGLKAILGELYGLTIPYFAEVNFDGFKRIVDALGGVTVNVQVPVVDDAYPADNGELMRVYIPAGVRHMTGAEALVYARSRHGSSDFDRAQRQQRILVSLRDQIGRAHV